MRTSPAGFVPQLGAQWLCAAMDLLLGQRDLAFAPALMSGFGSILDASALDRFGPAVVSLRQLGVMAASETQLRQLVHAALAWEEDHRLDAGFVEPPYAIDAERQRFPFRRRVREDDPVLQGMVQALVDGLPLPASTLRPADPTRPMFVATAAAESANRLSIDLSRLDGLDPAPRLDLDTPPSGPITVPIADLEQIAARLDEADLAGGVRKGEWLARLRDATGQARFHILQADRAKGVLVEAQTLRLDGLTHMIGLPGTGKTTLIVLLLMWLNERRLRAVVLLPSIEASLNLLAELRAYGADVGLLVGQSPQTRIEHARKFAERIGAGDTRGFGRSAVGAELLGLTCALGGFSDFDEGGPEFPHLTPPCTSVLQHAERSSGALARETSPHLCPLGAVCGRLTAPRELGTHRIWLGHVLSMDTRVGAHFTDRRVRYFEAIARTADLVIVDEADGAQAALDKKAIASLDLTGSEESYEHALTRELFLPLSAGRTNMTASAVQQYASSASDFRKLNHSLVNHLQRLRQELGAEGPLARFEDTFTTGANVLTALFAPQDISLLSGTDRLAEERRFNAIRSLWDQVVRQALFRRTDADSEQDVDEYGFDVARVARDLDRSEEVVRSAALQIADALRDWISEPLQARRSAYLDIVKASLFTLATPAEHVGAADQRELLHFLVGVTTVVMQFLSLVTVQQSMVAEGVHDQPFFQQGVSEDLARTVPEALIGRLSGVRFRVEEDGGRNKIRLQYVAFRGAPRVLLYRLHELLRHEGHPRGPNLLLASATSFLEESPTFHIPSGPHLVLRRREALGGWRESRYVFAPIPDPAKPSRMLRFSGAPLHQRESILRKMIAHYFLGEDPLVLQMVGDFDAGRRVGFVVNSYDQVRLVKEHLRRIRPDMADRVVGVTDRPPSGHAGDWVTASQVEKLGERDDWDALVFPMKSLARGVNIVFAEGPRARDAMLGTLVFLIRPHPAAESLDLVAGIAGAESLRFDQRVFFDGAGPGALQAAWRESRRELAAVTRRLLRFPIQASRLGVLAKPFTADIMVDVLQTIGRAMRNGCKARVIFADAAWAPLSALEGRAPDTASSSMLVAMRDILQARVSSEDPIEREIYTALYQPFLTPLEQCDGVRFSEFSGAGWDDD